MILDLDFQYGEGMAEFSEIIYFITPKTIKEENKLTSHEVSRELIRKERILFAS